MGQVTLQNVDDVIAYHKPSDADVVRIQNIRMASQRLIETILENAPDCADRSAAIRHVREGMMTANAAIVLSGIV